MANKELNKNVSKISDEVKQILKSHPWYGNLREMKNIMKRSVLLAQTDEITIDCLPKEFIDEQKSHEPTAQEFGAGDLKSVSEQAEKEIIIRALEQTNHNKSKTANLLKIDRKTLYNKIKSYNIKLNK